MISTGNTIYFINQLGAIANRLPIGIPIIYLGDREFSPLTDPKKVIRLYTGHYSKKDPFENTEVFELSCEIPILPYDAKRLADDSHTCYHSSDQVVGYKGKPYAVIVTPWSSCSRGRQIQVMLDNQASSPNSGGNLRLRIRHSIAKVMKRLINSEQYRIWHQYYDIIYDDRRYVFDISKI